MFFSRQKLFLLMLIVLRYPIDRDSQEFSKLDLYFLKDFELYPKCFENQSKFCKRVHLDYEFDENFTNKLNILLGVRHIRQLRAINNSNHRILAKYLARGFDVSPISEASSEAEAIQKLSVRFFNESRLDGFQFCPESEVSRFVEFFTRNHSRLSVWMHMNVDIQPILLPYLRSIGFPVPKTYGSCGFTTFQSVDGVPLANLYSAEFPVKLKIAANLIQGALQFSEGFDEFRIYITDLNMDNVVYSAEENRISFVDLDTVLIVDGRKHLGSTHRHEYLECDDCFAFSPSDMCAHDRSDLNLFAVCQLLRENLRKDLTKGFLYPVPEDLSDLQAMLSECVACPADSCQNRFEIAVKLMEHIENLIKDL